MNPLTLSLLSGACVAGGVYLNLANIDTALDFVVADLGARLRSLRITTPYLRRWVATWLVIVGGFGAAFWLGMKAPALGLLVVVLMLAGPWFVVRRLAIQRKQRIDEQMADAMVMFSSAIKAGLSIPQALELLAFELPPPISHEFHQMIGEYRLGKPLERTLTEAKERLNSENFVLFAAALLASRESGGKLNDTVERIAQAVVEMQRLERKLRTETAQARKSAVYMAVVPALLLVVYFWVDPVNTELLFTTLPGQLILVTATLLDLIAYFWARKILNADI